MQHLEFGKFQKEKRENLVPEISLNKFALDTGIEPATLSRIENMKQGVKLDTIYKIAAKYGLLGSELLAEYEKSMNIKKEDLLS